MRVHDRANEEQKGTYPAACRGRPPQAAGAGLALRYNTLYLDKDGKSDISLLVDDNTGKALSLDVVRSTWPIPVNIGTAAWLNAKKTAAAQFWRGKTESALCDICNTGIEQNSGYVLTSQDILANVRYVNYHTYYADPFTSIMLGEDYNKAEASLSQMEFVFKGGGISTSWLLCDECIADWTALKK